MILDKSENSESRTAQTVRSEGSEADPQSPPPYSPSSGVTSLGDQKPLPTPPGSLPAGSAGDYQTPLPQGLPPPCNYLIQRRSNDSIKGTWHVDPAMSVPDVLLASIEDFDGTWNEAEQKARKERKKLEKKGKRRSETLPAPTNAIRPNLMLSSNNGSIDAKVHVISSDGQLQTGPSLIVVEGRNGSIALDIKTYSPHPLRIHATSENGSVRVRVPSTFEGAVVATTKHGSIKISDPIKSRMTTFSGIADTTRAFIGDWQAAGFGTGAASSSLNPNDDPPLPTTPSDPFLSWSGPLIHIASRNGSVHLSYSEETQADEGGGSFASAFKGFMSELFGGSSETRERSAGPSGSGERPPWGDGAPWGNGAPWGDTKHPWGNGAPWGPPGVPLMSPPGPFGRGGGPFGRGGGPFARGGPFGRGCGSFRRGGFGGSSPGCSRRGGSEGNIHNQGEQVWDGDNVELDPYGFPKDKKDPSGT